MNRNSTRILISLSGFIVATLLLIGAIVGVHSIHRSCIGNESYHVTNTNLQTNLVVTDLNSSSLQKK